MIATPRRQPLLCGIRHHGPGSARATVRALTEYRPDIVLVEGPADADALLHWLADPEMVPPVALMGYAPEQPERMHVLPFATFSPEYQAIRYGLDNGCAVHFCDLPLRLVLGSGVAPASPDVTLFEEVARAAGYPATEPWWNALIEQRRDPGDLFAAILELMTALRTEAPTAPAGPTADDGTTTSITGDQPTRSGARLAGQREAWMRQTLRRALVDGARVAVVCGAWHAPALVDEVLAATAATDRVLLEGMPSADIAYAWIPWTYGRLAQGTGYGAGVSAPAWYHHLWQSGDRPLTATNAAWLGRIAAHLREAGEDASQADVIEATRLAHALAAIRGHVRPGMDTLFEAAQATMGRGRAEVMRPIRQALVIGERMGRLPEGVPLTPLQRDVKRALARLDLAPAAQTRRVTLPLGQPAARESSHVLHQLALLEVPYGKQQRSAGLGAQRETWLLRWTPALELRLIDRSGYGNTLRAAATQWAIEQATSDHDLTAVTQTLIAMLLAGLEDAVAPLLAHVQTAAAEDNDMRHLLGAVPPLARAARYGSVRHTDRDAIRRVTDAIITRICISLPGALRHLNADSAAPFLPLLDELTRILARGPASAQRDAWLEALIALADGSAIHGLIAGRATRLLFNHGAVDAEAAHRRLAHAFSGTDDPAALQDAAHWLEGFLTDGGLTLVHDRSIWTLIDRWMVQMSDDRFMGVLPLLRRTFQSFDDHIRRTLQERAGQGVDGVTATRSRIAVDAEAAAAIWPLAEALFGREASL